MSVANFGSPETLLAALQDSPPAAVVLDNGCDAEALQKIAEACPAACIILLAGHDDRAAAYDRVFAGKAFDVWTVDDAPEILELAGPSYAEGATR